MPFTHIRLLSRKQPILDFPRRAHPLLRRHRALLPNFPFIRLPKVPRFMNNPFHVSIIPARRPTGNVKNRHFESRNQPPLPLPQRPTLRSRPKIHRLAITQKSGGLTVIVPSAASNSLSCFHNTAICSSFKRPFAFAAGTIASAANV